MKNNRSKQQWRVRIEVGFAMGVGFGLIFREVLQTEWGLLIGIVIGFAVGILLSSFFQKSEKPVMQFAPGKFRNMILMAIGYVLSVVLVIFLLEGRGYDRWSYILPALTLIPAFGLVIVLFDGILSLDELQSKIMTHSITFAFFCSFMVICTLSIFELTGVQSIPMVYMPLIMAFFLAVGKLVTIRRY